MNIKVMYHSSTGNTKKIADAIAKTLNTSAETIMDGSFSFSEPIDLLLIGDGIYFGSISKKTKEFILRLDSNKVKKAAAFSTYGGQDKAVSQMKQLLKQQGIKVFEKSFSCKGQSWIFLNRNHPDKSDYEMTHKYAKSLTARPK